MKSCTQCRLVKPYTEFYPARRMRDGRKSWCKSCGVEAGREWRKQNPERSRELQRRAEIKSEYGFTVREYDALVAQPCAICGSHERMHLDHDHESGTIRAALCQRCNQGLGLFREDPALLKAAASYLRVHKARIVRELELEEIGLK